MFLKILCRASFDAPGKLRTKDTSMKNDTFVSPLEDFAFKQVFGERRNIDNTRAFLKTVLNIPGEE